MTRTTANAPQMDLGEYLLQRLAQLGLGSLHGVPGDYNLTVLDYLEPAHLHWVGNANELCAGYAADGYARIKGISDLITSFGVGDCQPLMPLAHRSPRRSLWSILSARHQWLRRKRALVYTTVLVMVTSGFLQTCTRRLPVLRRIS